MAMKSLLQKPNGHVVIFLTGISLDLLLIVTSRTPTHLKDIIIDHGCFNISSTRVHQHC